MSDTLLRVENLTTVFDVAPKPLVAVNDISFEIRKGETLALPGGTSMRAVVTGSTPRHVLAVIVHDAAQPATMRMDEGTGPPLVACK